LDGIVGVRGRIGLGSGKWGIPYYLDVGTGSWTVTWQAVAGIQYRWSWIDLNLAYRYLNYDMESGKLLQGVSFAGPALGVNFRF
jgi:opacity protein-like surface antigen